MRNSLVLVALAGMAAAPAVATDRTGFYFAADAGVSSFDISKNDVDELVFLTFNESGLDVLAGESTLDDEDTAFGVTLGYRFAPFMAVEASYLDLGQAEYKASGLVTDGVSTAAVDLGLTAESSGPALSLLGMLPINEAWDVYARAGVFFADTQQAVRATVDGFSVSDSLSESSEEFLWGVGTGYTFGEQWTVRLDYQQIQDVGNEETTGKQTWIG